MRDSLAPDEHYYFNHPAARGGGSIMLVKRERENLCCAGCMSCIISGPILTSIWTRPKDEMWHNGDIIGTNDPTSDSFPLSVSECVRVWEASSTAYVLKRQRDNY